MIAYVVKRASPDSRLTDPWSRQWPEHVPIERSVVRLGDGWVLIDGWQRRYVWDLQHRRHVVLEMRSAHVARLRALSERKHCSEKRKAKLGRKVRAVGR